MLLALLLCLQAPLDSRGVPKQYGGNTDNTSASSNNRLRVGLSFLPRLGVERKGHVMILAGVTRQQIGVGWNPEMGRRHDVTQTSGLPFSTAQHSRVILCSRL
jgi:hypothetical protein